MKIECSTIVGILAILILVASFVVPVKLAMPEPVAANPGLMEWTPVDTPDIEVNQIKALYSPIVGVAEGGSEIVKLLVGNDGQTIYAIVARGVADRTTKSVVRFLKSSNGGISWSTAVAYANLDSVVGVNTDDAIVWDMAIATGDPNFIIAAVSTVADQTRQSVYISQDGGANWQDTQWPPTGYGGAQGPTLNTAFISTMEISMDYDGGRDVLVATRSGASNANNIWTLKVPGFGGWNVQNSANGVPPSNGDPGTVDVIAAKFSTTYSGDSTVVMVYSNTSGTFLMTGVHDLAQNLTTWSSPGIEVKNSGSPAGTSPRVTEIITADLELPSDFSGQSASLRRFYVSTDAINRVGAPGYPNRGVYRIDDNTVYTLMDNSTTYQTAGENPVGRRAASIAYWGTYASGKLLVGERIG